MNALEQRGAALDTETGVDVLLGQRRQTSVVVELELHEDEVPELEEAIAFAPRRAIRPLTAVLRAAVVVELRAGPARPGRPRLPEVLGARQAPDPIGRDADPKPPVDGHLVLAEAELRVAREDRRPETLGGEAEMLENELPCEVDRAVLEVVAEREVAEHLEERAMPGSEPDRVDVGRPKDLLHGRQPWAGRLLEPSEVGLQRLHPGGREQDRRIVGSGDEGGRGPPEVTLRLEVGEEALAQLVTRAHGIDSTGGRSDNPVVRATRARPTSVTWTRRSDSATTLASAQPDGTVAGPVLPERRGRAAAFAGRRRQVYGTSPSSAASAGRAAVVAEGATVAPASPPTARIVAPAAVAADGSGGGVGAGC